MSIQIDIRKKLGSFALEVAFQAESEVVGLLGASGCGKSMTLKCIEGVETPDEGRIVVNGQVYYDSAARINLKARQRKTALLFQNFQLFPHMTVEANIAAGIDKSVGKEVRAELVRKPVQRFALTGMEKRFPYHLSGGQQQRVALARMLAADSGILMLDEPFSALDAHLKELLEQNLTGLFESYEGTILYVSHDIDEALRFCDRIAVMEEGQIVELSNARALIDDPKSEASVKLSGCKNVTAAERVDDHRVWLPRWGIEVASAAEVPADVKSFGVRATYLERADGPGENCFRVRCDRATDSRFERTIMLGFLDARIDRSAFSDPDDNEMSYLHQHMIWRKGLRDPDVPERGDELWVRIPADRIYLVTR